MARSLSSAMFLLLTVAACDNGKEPAPVASTRGSAAMAPGSAAEPAGSAAPVATAKSFDGPSFTVTSTLSGPTTKTSDLDTAVGKVTMTMYTFEDPADQNAAQIVQTTPVTLVGAATTKALYDAMEGMRASVNATIDDQKMITVNGAETLDFTGHFTDPSPGGGEFFVRGRIAVKNNTLHQAVALGQGRKPSASATRFAESFALK